MLLQVNPQYKIHHQRFETIGLNSFMTEVPIIKTSTFICSGNFWISLYMIETSVMKELIRKTEYRLTNSLLLFRMFVSSQIPVDTRRRFNVYKTCIWCCWHLIEVGTTSCVYWSRSLSPWKYQKARVSLFSGVTKRECWLGFQSGFSLIRNMTLTP